MSLYSALTQVLAPFAAKIKGIQTGYDGTEYESPGEAVRDQINDLHVLIGHVPGRAIDASAVAYNDSNVAAELTTVNGRLGNVKSIFDTITGERATLEWKWGQIQSIVHTRMHTEKIPIFENSVLFVPDYVGDIRGILYFYDANGTKITTSETASWTRFNTALPQELKDYVVSKGAVTMQMEIRKSDNTEFATSEFERVKSGISVIAVDDYAVINQFPKLKEIEKDLKNWLQPVDTNTEDETGKTDMRDAIQSMLQNTGYCKLAPGIFYVSGGIDMPAGSTLEDAESIQLYG